MGIGKYSPTVSFSYSKNQDWFDIARVKDGSVDEDGYDSYGYYDSDGPDRAGNYENDYYFYANGSYVLNDLVHSEWSGKLIVQGEITREIRERQIAAHRIRKEVQEMSDNLLSKKYRNLEKSEVTLPLYTSVVSKIDDLNINISHEGDERHAWFLSDDRKSVVHAHGKTTPEAIQRIVVMADEMKKVMAAEVVDE